jgi:hypothetical protein
MGYAKPCPCSQVSTTLSVYAALVQANSYSIRTQCRGQRPRPTWSVQGQRPRPTWNVQGQRPRPTWNVQGQRPRPTWSLPTTSLRPVSVRQGRVIECWGVAKR